MAPRSTLVAVDTNFLLDLAVPKDKAHEAVEIITSDEHIRSADPTLLSLTLKSCDVGAILVRTPFEIARQFGDKR